MSVTINGKECGVTSTGFVRPLLADLKADLEASYRTIYGNPNLDIQAVFGQEIAAKTKALTDAWETAEVCYNTFDPSAASADAMDNLLAFCLLTRRPAIKTEVVCTCTFSGAARIDAGKQVKNTSGDIFEAVDAIVATGAGTVDGTFRAVVAGAIPAVASTVTIIFTPVSTWTAVTNAADGTIGRAVETDAEARVRRADSLLVGTGPLESIVAALLNEVANVTSVSGFENETDTTDANGVPPHAYHFVVLGGTDQDVADKIWAKKGGGIQTYGNTSATVTDSNGTAHTIYFSRPINKYVWVKVTIDSYYTEESFPADGSDEIKAAIVAYGNALGMGKDLIVQRWQIPVYSVPGIGDITIEHAITDAPGDTPSYSSVNLAIGPTSVATMATSRISVVLPGA